MKRSQMLDIIREAFDNCLEIPNSSFIIIEDYNKYILKAIEEAGMQPPHNGTQGYCAEDWLNNSKWEPEDGEHS